jgi:class 3 adenylate cyclase
LERLAWSYDILTAAQVTNLQEFRELFETQVISPHEQITVGSQVIVFTDLRGSTAMYNRVGDAPAYGLVRTHFDVLSQAVRNHHGGIVKTIGDAVMAVFSDLADGLAAVHEMHEKLPGANPDPSMSARLSLKTSLHLGPCLAVNANDKLDFFGSTINLAARMVGSCKGDDLTVSDDLYRRPEMEQFLDTLNVTAEPSEVTFRGFDTPLKVWRVPMAQQIGITPVFQPRIRQGVRAPAS